MKKYIVTKTTIIISGIFLYNISLATKLENPLGEGVTDLTQIYGRLIFGFMAITGVLAFIMFLVGGFQWMTAAGNTEKIKKGKDTLMWAVLGLVIIFSSYAILRTIFETLKF